MISGHSVLVLISADNEPIIRNTLLSRIFISLCFIFDFFVYDFYLFRFLSLKYLTFFFFGKAFNSVDFSFTVFFKAI